MIGWNLVAATAEHRQFAAAGYPDECDSSWLPQFPFRAQLLHPAFRTEIVGGYPRAHQVSWKTVARTLNADLDEHSTFGSLVGSNTPDAVVEGVFDVPPEVGELPHALLAFFDAFADDSCSGLIWRSLPATQRSTLRYEDVAEVHVGTGMQYVAVHAYAASAAAEIMPNIWWPADHSFCVATGIDEQHTVVLTREEEILNTFLQQAGQHAVEYRKTDRYC